MHVKQQLEETEQGGDAPSAACAPRRGLALCWVPGLQVEREVGVGPSALP